VRPPGSQLGYLNEALRLNRRHRDENGEITIHLIYARVYDLRDQHEEAPSHARLAEQVAWNSTDLRYRPGVLTAVARRLAYLGQDAAALPLCEKGRDLHAQVNSRDGQAMSRCLEWGQERDRTETGWYGFASMKSSESLAEKGS